MAAKFKDHRCRNDVEVSFDATKFETLKPILQSTYYTKASLMEMEIDEKRTYGFNILTFEIVRKNGSRPHRVQLTEMEVEELVTKLGMSWPHVKSWWLVAPGEEPGVEHWELRIHTDAKVYPNALGEDCFIPVFRKPDDFDTIPKWQQNVAMRVPWLYLHIKHLQTSDMVTYHKLRYPFDVKDPDHDRMI